MEGKTKIILIIAVVILLIIIAFIMGRHYQVRRQIRQTEFENEIKRRINEALSKVEVEATPNIKPASVTYDKSSVTSDGKTVYEEQIQ